MTIEWHRDPKGGVQRAEKAQPENLIETAGPSSSESVQPQSISPSTWKNETAGLPEAPAPWKFREQTSAWADSLASRLRNSAKGKESPTLVAGVRLIQGAFMHRNIYREAAARPELTREAFYIAGAILAAGFIGILIAGGLSGIFARFNFGLLWRFVLLRVVGWGCAAYAIQIAAKSLNQVKVDQPVMVWFRTLIYAQAPLLLTIVPGLGTICALWAGICTVAAIYDLTGRGTKAAVMLTVIGGVASAIGVRIAASLLR